MEDFRNGGPNPTSKPAGGKDFGSRGIEQGDDEKTVKHGPIPSLGSTTVFSGKISTT